MKRIWLLKVIGICLFVLTALFLVGGQRAVWATASIEFEVEDEYADQAKYIKWEIRATKTYTVKVYFKDNDGDGYAIHFVTANDPEDTTAKTDYFQIKIGKDFYDSSDPDKMTFKSTDLDFGSTFDPSFERLTDLYVNKGGSHQLVAGDTDAEVVKVEIVGDEFKLYYIGMFPTSSFTTAYWEIDVGEEDWEDYDDFEDSGGDYDDDDTQINFGSSSYIQVTPPATTTWPYTYYSGAYPYYSGTYPYGYGGSMYGGYPYSYGTNYAAGYGGYPMGGSYGGYGGSMYGSPYGGSMYGSPYGGSMYGSPYGGGYGGSMYGSQYGGSMYGSPYGSQFGSMYGSQFGSPYGSQFGSMYGGTPFGAGIPGINTGLGAGFAPMGLPIPPAGLGLGLGFDPFGFGLGLTGMGAFDPLSIAAFAGGFPGLGLGLGLGFGLF